MGKSTREEAKHTFRQFAFHLAGTLAGGGKGTAREAGKGARAQRPGGRK